MREVMGRYVFSDAQRENARMLKLDIPAHGYVGERKGGPTRKFTVGEFMRMAEAGIFDSDERVELIDGVIVEMAPIGRPHGNRVSDIVMAFAEKRPSDVRVYIGSTIRLNEQTGPQPDVALLTSQASLDEENIPGPGDILLIVEVSDSILRTDRSDKARRYAESGISELWIVIIASEEIEVHRQPTPQGYADIQRYRRGDTLTVQALPDVRVGEEELLA